MYWCKLVYNHLSFVIFVTNSYKMALEDNRNIAVPQTGMNRDLHPSSLTGQHYTFALNANIESEDGNVGMRSNEHSNLKCIDFDGFKVIGYKNDLTSGDIYFL